VRLVEGEDGPAVVSPDRDLADDRQPVGVGIERFADQVVDDTGPVVLGRVDVIDSGGYRGPEHADGRGPVRWHPEANGPASCMAPYPDRLTCSWPSAKVDIVAALGPESAARVGRNGGIKISR
jgi:hypothetical protein